MRDEDPDFLDVLEEHDLEHESADYSSDSEQESETEDVTEEDLLDEYSEYLDYDG